MATINRELYNNYKIIRRLIEQYGKVRIIFGETIYDDVAKKHTANNNLRRRIVTKDGSSKVSYKGADYDKWSGYSTSCFVACGAKDFKEALKKMRKHDGTWLKPIEVHYGWFFRNKVRL